MKYKAGKYRLQVAADLFEKNAAPNEIKTLVLSSQEANTLLSNKLFERLGFCSWSLVEPSTSNNQ